MNTATGTALDEGFTLVELLIYGGLLALMLAIVGGTIISTTLVGQSVRTVTQATSEAQAVATSVDSAIRQASWFDLRAVSDGQYLTTRTAGGGESLTWYCRAWYFDSSNGTLHTKTSTSGFAQPASAPTTWHVVAAGVSGPGGVIFARSSTGSGLTIDLAMEVTDQPDVTISTTTQTRQLTTGSAPCS